MAIGAPLGRTIKLNVQVIANHRNFCVSTIFILIIFLAREFHSEFLSGLAFIGFLLHIFLYIDLQRGVFQSLFQMLIGLIVWGVSYQIVRELVGSWMINDLTLMVGLILTSHLIFRLEHENQRKISSLAFVAIYVPLGLAWVFLSTLNDTTLINFLGYGYDNYAHLAQARLIITNEGTTFLSAGNPSWPTFLQDQSQAPAALIATIAEIVLPNPQVYTTLKILVVATFCIPVAVIVGAVFLFSKLQKHKASILVASSLVITVVLSGYLSRIWFSGYFASNLGTLILIFISLAVAADEFQRPDFLIWSVIACLHCYPLLGLVSGLIALPTIISLLLQGMKQAPRLLQYLFRRQHFFALMFGASVFLPFIATRRSYDASQFLVAGGIEPIPISILGIWLLFLFVFPSIVVSSKVGTWLNLFCVISAFAVAVASSYYSISRLNYVSYYPAKIVISVTFVIVLSSVIAILKHLTGFTHILGISLLAFAGISYIVFFPSAKIFTSAYMGDLPTTLKSTYVFETAVVDPSAVASLANLSLEYSKPVLYIPANSESELNTRWINTLSGFWNDASWASWTMIRNKVDEGNFRTAAGLILAEDIFLATNSSAIFSEMSILIPESVCFFGTQQRCGD